MTCEYHSWPLDTEGWHTGPEDPEGLEGRTRMPCGLWRDAVECLRGVLRVADPKTDGGYSLVTAERLLAALAGWHPEHLTAFLDGDLGAAWAEAEAALPEGWRIDSLGLNPDETWQVFFSSSDTVDAAIGPTPAAALYELALRLAGVTEGEPR
jgi:hypothetical protein